MLFLKTKLITNSFLGPSFTVIYWKTREVGQYVDTIFQTYNVHTLQIHINNNTITHQLHEDRRAVMYHCESIIRSDYNTHLNSGPLCVCVCVWFLTCLTHHTQRTWALIMWNRGLHCELILASPRNMTFPLSLLMREANVRASTPLPTKC